MRLTAEELILNGSILADGMSGSTAGSGSGGGIRLDLGSLAGNGNIYARGGSNSGSNSASAGGGGRVAIYYSNLQFFAGNIGAGGGKSSSGNNSLLNGGAGTIYLKDSAQLNGDLILDNGGVVTGWSKSPRRLTLGDVRTRNGGSLGLNGRCGDRGADPSAAATTP